MSIATMESVLTAFEEKHQPGLYTGNPTHAPMPVHQSPLMSILEDGNQFVLECLGDIDAVEQIADEWRNLEQTSGEPYVYFQSYDWCIQWCKTFAKQDANSTFRELRIYILRRNSKLVMVWPMMVVKAAAGLTNLTFLSEPHSQYGNIICNRNRLPLPVGKKVWAFIRKNSNVDMITLDQYPKNSLLKEILNGKGIIEKSEKHASILDLNAFETWDEYKASLPRKMRKQRNQRRNKLAKIGEVKYETHFGGTQSYREHMALALEWKQIWLKETGRRAIVLSQDTTKEFLTNLNGSNGEENGQPRGVVLGVLKTGGKPIGIEIGMCLNGHYYCYLGAFDWEFRKMSPGKIQMEESQIWAKNAGLAKFDFLGDPADYKSAWTNTTDELESRSVPQTTRGFLYCVLWKAYLRPLSRSIFNNLTAEKRTKLLNILGLSKSKTAKTPQN